MAVKTMADEINEAHRTGHEAHFDADGHTYDFNPEGLKEYIEGSASSVASDVNVLNWPASQPVAATVQNWPTSQRVMIGNTDPIPIDMVNGHFRPLPKGHDRSVTIAVGDVWQTVVPETRSRTGLAIQIVSDSGELWITEFTTGGKTKGSPGTMRLQPGQVYWSLTCNEIDILSETTGLAVTIIETLDD